MDQHKVPKSSPALSRRKQNSATSSKVPIDFVWPNLDHTSSRVGNNLEATVRQPDRHSPSRMSVSSRQSNRKRSAVRHRPISKVRGDGSSRVAREDTDENDLQSRVVSHQTKQQIQTEPVSESDTK